MLDKHISTSLNHHRQQLSQLPAQAKTYTQEDQLPAYDVKASNPSRLCSRFPCRFICSTPSSSSSPVIYARHQAQYQQRSPSTSTTRSRRSESSQLQSATTHQVLDALEATVHAAQHQLLRHPQHSGSTFQIKSRVAGLLQWFVQVRLSALLPVSDTGNFPDPQKQLGINYG